MRVFKKNAAFLASASLAIGAFAAATGTAYAAPPVGTAGPAPAPSHRTVIAGVHADAISTFWDQGQLVLAAKADTPTAHTRYEADQVWFHVSNGLRLTGFPAGFEFVAAPGSTVWIAPETQVGGELWPGFSTESVPLGTLDGNDTTLTLVGVEGPGDVELWQSGTFGAPQRLWSSDEDGFKSFTRGNVHMHANWAFTQPGIYALTVAAQAKVGGAPVGDTAVYTFVVGDLPAQAVTTTQLHVHGASTVVVGEELELHATVEPASVQGYVEFRDGQNVLGHVRLAAGEAEFLTEDLSLGDHQVTAVFVPEVDNLAKSSASAPVNVVVANAPTGQVVELGALDGHYHQGSPIHLSLNIDPAPAAGDTIQWQWKWPGGEWSPIPGNPTDSWTVAAEQALNGVEVRVALIRADPQAAPTFSETRVIHEDDHGAAALQAPAIGGKASYLVGEPLSLRLELPEGVSTVLTDHLWEKKLAGSGDWTPVGGQSASALTLPAALGEDGASFRVSILKPTGEVAYGPSAPVSVSVAQPGAALGLGRLAQEYSLTLLEPTNGGASAGALGLNDQGDVVGITRPTSSAQPQRTVLWEAHGDHFHAHELANLDGSQFSRGFDVNNQGQIVGEAFDSQGASIPIRWEGTTAPEHVTSLNAAGTGILNDIDNDGVAVGSASGAAVRLAADGAVTTLPIPGPAGTTAASLTATTIADGQVVGGRGSLTLPGQSGSRLLGVVWDAQGARLLETPQGASSPAVAGVRSDGLAVGSATAGSTERPVAWGTDGVPYTLALPEVSDYTHAAAKAVSGGVIVGYTSKFAGNTSFGGAATGWDATGAVDLNSRVAALPEGVTLQSASDVNESGQIVGTAATADGARGFVLTPVAEPVPTTVVITNFLERFVAGQVYTLTAAHSPTVEGATYSWELKQTGAESWYTIRDAQGPVTTADLTFTAQQGWDGFLWRVAVLDAEGHRVAESTPQEMRVELPAPTEPGLHILGLAGHYHSSQPVTLTAVLAPEDPAPATFRWSVQRADQAGPHVVQETDSEVLTLTAEQALDGAIVTAERLVGGEVTHTSAPVTVAVDDHGAAAPQVVSIAGEPQAVEGQTVTLTATVAPSTVLDRYQWYVKAPGADEASPVAGATSATHAFTATADLNGAEFSVAVVGEDGTVVYGPSAPVALAVTRALASAPAAPAKPGIVAIGSTVTVTWEAPADGGSPITGYTVQLLGGPEPLAREVAASATSAVFTDLGPGTYRATVVAVNAVGASPASEASAQVVVIGTPEPSDSGDPTPGQSAPGQSASSQAALPVTGSSLRPQAAIGVATCLILIGAATLLGSRRRKLARQGPAQ
ncbi:MAG: choice-of-anchor M domain-containing protein [Bifidobacteriaceae bacterium]|jgi:surface-anchored protein|nr:choice-of-anchor M domain-containing protein [Bifidobacteriaceae bacterium]